MDSKMTPQEQEAAKLAGTLSAAEYEALDFINRYGKDEGLDRKIVYGLYNKGLVYFGMPNFSRFPTDAGRAALASAEAAGEQPPTITARQFAESVTIPRAKLYELEVKAEQVDALRNQLQAAEDTVRGLREALSTASANMYAVENHLAEHPTDIDAGYLAKLFQISHTKISQILPAAKGEG